MIAIFFHGPSVGRAMKSGRKKSVDLMWWWNRKEKKNVGWDVAEHSGRDTNDSRGSRSGKMYHLVALKMMRLCFLARFGQQ